jgi:hypothetical protein
MVSDFYRHLIETSATRIEDSWHRRETAARHVHTLNVLGYRFTLRTNSEQVIALAEISERRFSDCPPIAGARRGEIDLFVTGDVPDDALPLMQLEKQFTTVAHGERGIIHLGRWGAISADWSKPAAFGFIAPALLQHPAIASRHCLDTFMLVALLRQPLGMLHASALIRDGHAVLLIGPHGAGKSTTALHLIRAGYRLISDTLIFARRLGAQMQITGYAVGELKLTTEGRALFPELPLDSPDRSLDGRRKPIYDLRALMPERIEDSAVAPRSIALCLTRRSADAATHLLPLDEDIMLYQIIRDTSYLDEADVMAQNLAVIDQLIKHSRNYVLELGSDPAEIVAAVDSTAVRPSRQGGP